MSKCHFQQHDGPRDYHTKWCKSDRERQILYDITYMWNLKIIQMNLCIKQKQTQRHRRQTYSCQKDNLSPLGLFQIRVWD